jgi:hypothetical protein
VANLIYKPLVLEPGVLILVGSFQQVCVVYEAGVEARYTSDREVSVPKIRRFASMPLYQERVS